MTNLEPQKLLEIFQSSISNIEGVRVRKMFGFPCAFFNDQMFMYLYHHGLVLRLNEADRAMSLEQGATPFAPKGGRGMREYVVMPDNIVGHQVELEQWIAQSLELVQGLKAKAKKRN